MENKDTTANEIDVNCIPVVETNRKPEQVSVK